MFYTDGSKDSSLRREKKRFPCLQRPPQDKTLVAFSELLDQSTAPYEPAVLIGLSECNYVFPGLFNNHGSYHQTRIVSVP